MEKVTIILFGLPGTGKSTVGARLARELQYEFHDMDNTLPEEMREKLKRNEIIQEKEFTEYLTSFIKDVSTLTLVHKKGLVVAAGIFKEKHRKMLLDAIPQHVVLVLNAPIEVLRTRLRNRPRHFFGEALIDEAIKESDAVDAAHFLIDTNQSLEKVMTDISHDLER
ncbi:AAA family ATPase [Candidatus Kaiserbacteria bacterium]|nr:AAA family ATPase [Candidatus Kaiserbacteria bacterium]